MRALLMLNERSRRGEREGAAVCRALEELGVECERDPAAAASPDVLIAAGGDGTVISSIGTAIERDLPLGIVPLGTFNDLARTLGVPLETQAACAAIVAGKTRRIDVGRVNGVHFVNEASIGLSARIAGRQTPEVKQRFGALGILATTLQTLRETRRFFVALEYDGTVERFHTVQLTIANSARFGGIIERPDAAIDDGWLDLYSVEAKSWWEGLVVVRKILARDPSSGEGLRTRRSARFTVRTHHAHRVAADGEPAGTTPATFDILPGAVRVIVP